MHEARIAELRGGSVLSGPQSYAAYGGAGRIGASFAYFVELSRGSATAVPWERFSFVCA